MTFSRVIIVRAEEFLCIHTNLLGVHTDLCARAQSELSLFVHVPPIRGNSCRRATSTY